MAHLTKDNIVTLYEESKEHMRKYFDPLDEFERIARNKPSPKIGKDLPKVTDGTLAAIIQEQPKRIIQQTPTGVVQCPDLPGIATIASTTLNDTLIPRSNTMGQPLQKSWNMVGKALTYGMQSSYTYFTNTGETMHTDFTLPYVKDVLLEKGKVYGPDCNYLFMQSWVTNHDIDAIITKEARLKKADKSYKSSWDIKALKKLKDMGGSGKSSDQQTPDERDKGEKNGAILIVHGFQEGISEDFLSFSPDMPDDILRVKENKDPRGKMPIDFLYANIDLSNPLGRGAIELSGGVQNLIDHQMTMFQYMTTMMMGPPLQVWGNVNKRSLALKPNTIWDMGAQQNNRIEPYRVDNNAIANFPNNYGLLKSQILNLNSSMDSSVSAEAGNPGFSKTHAGVEQNQQRLSISDNYMRKQFETWWSDQNETALNLYYAEMEGTDSVPISDDMRKELPPELLEEYTNDKGELDIKYDDIQDITFKFEVDASSSQVKEDGEAVEKLTTVLDLLRTSQNPQVLEGEARLFNAIVKEIGIENADEIFPTMNQGSATQVDEQGNPITDEQGNPLPPEAMGGAVQGGPPQDTAPTDENEAQFVNVLLEEGFEDEEIETALLAVRQGVPAQEILAALDQSRGGPNGR